MTWPVPAAAVVLGFAVAEATGVRDLGGLVIAAGFGWYVAAAWPRDGGFARVAVLGGVMLGVVVGSHALADAIGAWPAVLVAAAATAVATWVAERRGPA